MKNNYAESSTIWRLFQNIWIAKEKTTLLSHALFIYEKSPILNFKQSFFSYKSPYNKQTLHLSHKDISVFLL